MERSLTLDEFVQLVHQTEIRLFRNPKGHIDQFNIEEEIKDVFKILKDIGRGSAGTGILAALEIHPNDFTKYYKVYRDIFSEELETPGETSNGRGSNVDIFRERSIQDRFYKKLGISQEEGKKIKTDSKIIALKRVNKERLSSITTSMISPASDSIGDFSGPGRVTASKYVDIITNIMKVNNPYLAKYDPSRVIISEENVYIPMEILNFRMNTNQPDVDIGAPGENSFNRLYEILKGDYQELRDLLQPELPLIFARICFGLGSAYQAQIEGRPIVHRDLKPANIMIDVLAEESDLANVNFFEALTDVFYWNPQAMIRQKLIDRKPIIPKVIDFGIAKEGPIDVTLTYNVKGTALYIPPEEILYESNPMTADVYQIGVMLMDVFVHNGDIDLKKFTKLLQKETFETYNILRKSKDKDVRITHKFQENEFTSIWIYRDLISSEKKVEAEILRKKTIESVVQQLEVKDNPLMTQVIRKAMAPEPKHRYKSMTSLRYDILLATKNEELSALEERAKRNNLNLYDKIALLNEIGSLLQDLESTDETEIRTDYRNGRVITNQEVTLGEYFLEENKWHETKNIRHLYAVFKNKIAIKLPKIPIKTDDIAESVEEYKEILRFADEYSGLNTIVRYVAQDERATLTATPIRKILQNLFDDQKEEQKKEYERFLKRVSALGKGNLTEEKRIAIGTELDTIEWSQDKFKQGVSARQIIMAIYEPGCAAELKNTQNKFYT